MRVKVRLSTKGINEAKKQVAKYKAQLRQRIIKMVNLLAEKGYEIAQVGFMNAQYAGDNDVQVTVEQASENQMTAKIIASGKSVLFIEFGTGTRYPEHHSGMFTHGVYGKGFGDSQKYPNGWIYKGEQGNFGQPVFDSSGKVRNGVYRSKGNPPAEAMWNATTTIAREIEQVWREVMQ